MLAQAAGLALLSALSPTALLIAARPLRALGRRGLPVLGSCAGLIMLDRDHLAMMDIRAERNAFGRQLLLDRLNPRRPVGHHEHVQVDPRGRRRRGRRTCRRARRQKGLPRGERAWAERA